MYKTTRPGLPPSRPGTLFGRSSFMRRGVPYVWVAARRGRESPRSVWSCVPQQTPPPSWMPSLERTGLDRASTVLSLTPTRRPRTLPMEEVVGGGLRAGPRPGSVLAGQIVTGRRRGSPRPESPPLGWAFPAPVPRSSPTSLVPAPCSRTRPLVDALRFLRAPLSIASWVLAGGVLTGKGTRPGRLAGDGGTSSTMPRVRPGSARPVAPLRALAARKTGVDAASLAFALRRACRGRPWLRVLLARTEALPSQEKNGGCWRSICSTTHTLDFDRWLRWISIGGASTG